MSQVLDQKTGGLQGKLEYDLNLLLQQKGLEVTGEMFSLSGAQGGMAEVKLTLTLRVKKKYLPAKYNFIELMKNNKLIVF